MPRYTEAYLLVGVKIGDGLKQISSAFAALRIS